MINQERSPECWGCGGEDHRAGECPQMQEFLRQGIVTQDPNTRRYLLHNGQIIKRRWNETIADAVQRIQTLSYRPAPAPASNLVTLEADVQNYYQQVHYDDEDSDGYESDLDDGPYWQVALNTCPRYKAYQNEEYEYDYEDDEEEEDYYAEPAYEVYPAERSSTRIAAAREKASQMPGKVPPKQKFEGVFPPPRKVQPTANPPAIQPTRPPPVPAPPAPRPPAPAPAPKKQRAAPPPAPPRARVSIQAPAPPVSRTAPPPAPRQPPAVPRHPQPVDARQPCNTLPCPLIPHGIHVEWICSMWNPWNPHGIHGIHMESMESTWNPWNPHGIHMEYVSPHKSCTY